MIFVTVGSTHFPFDRLLCALGSLPIDELVVQHGPGSAPPGPGLAVSFLSFTETMEYFAGADHVVTHAGVGSIFAAIRAGHTPLVVPRLRRFGEAVDDHQVELTAALGETGKVIPVWDIERMADLLAGAPSRAPKTAAAERPIHAAVGRALANGGGVPLAKAEPEAEARDLASFGARSPAGR